MQVAAAIIAGGRARRLGGVAKPFLRVGGRTIAERQLAVLRPLFTRVLAVVAAALGAVPADGAVVCVAGDLPFLSPAILAALRDADPDALAAMPRVGERAEPLCARYAARLLPEVQARLSSGRLALHQLAEEMGATAWIEGAALAQLDAGGRAFLNVNTPEDLARAEVLVRSDP